MSGLNYEKDDDEDDFKFHPSDCTLKTLQACRINKSDFNHRQPVEHDEDIVQEEHPSSSLATTINTQNQVHVTVEEMNRYCNSLQEPESPAGLLYPLLFGMHQKDLKLLSHSMGCVNYGNAHLVWIFADYWKDVSLQYERDLHNYSMAADSEGVIMCNLLYIDRLQQYHYPHHYERITASKLDHCLVSTESIKAVGAGQFGKVFQAIDRKTNHKFAEKIVKVEKFSMSELEILSRINHVHIISFYGCIRTTNAIHIFMHFAGGGNILQLLQNNLGFVGDNVPDAHLFCEHWAVNYYKQILSALVYLHERNIVHCDIKPSNVVLSSDKRNCFLTDFGEVRQIFNNNGYVELENTVGTENYISPEVIELRRYYFVSDVWSASCFLLHMLTGNTPWTISYPELGTYLIAITRRPFGIVNEIPHWCHNLTKSMLQSSFKDVEERKQSCELLKLANKVLILLQKSNVNRSTSKTDSVEMSNEHMDSNDIDENLVSVSSNSISQEFSSLSQEPTSNINSLTKTNEIDDIGSRSESSNTICRPVQSHSVSLHDSLCQSRNDDPTEIELTAAVNRVNVDGLEVDITSETEVLVELENYFKKYLSAGD